MTMMGFGAYIADYDEISRLFVGFSVFRGEL